MVVVVVEEGAGPRREGPWWRGPVCGFACVWDAEKKGQCA